MTKSLKKDGKYDYLLKPGHHSVWINVDNISVYICRTDEGVVIDLYPKGNEMDVESLSSTWLSFSEAEDAVNNLFSETS